MMRFTFLLIFMLWGGILTAAQRPHSNFSFMQTQKTLTTEGELALDANQSFLQKWMQKRLKKKWHKIENSQISQFNYLGLIGAVLTIPSSIAILASGFMFSGVGATLAFAGLIIGTILAVVSLVQISRSKWKRIHIRPKVLSYIALIPLLVFIGLLGVFLNS